MSAFEYAGGELRVEGMSLTAIAERYGTPCYVYSRAMLTQAYREFDAAFEGIPHLVCYAMKANSSLAIVDLFARLGSGFDIVSGGELTCIAAAGADARKAVFSGVGKSDAEMEAALAAGILCFNVESASELDHLAAVARRMGVRAPVSLRVNPDVDPLTHPYISTGLKESKFGIAFADAPALYRRAAAMPSIAVQGIDIHIGSQITELDPYREAGAKVLALVDALAAEGIRLSHVDFGGGLGIRYRDESPVAIADYAGMLRGLVAGRRETLLFEPGRRLVGEAGVLLTRVRFVKPQAARNFAIVDAAMNDLLRPSLYEAWHAIDPVRPRSTAARVWDIVGPVCESGDFLGHDRMLALEEGDLLAVRAAGAYAMSMSSNYNSRPRACEVLVDGDSALLIRRRETIAELHALEIRLP
ncbi:MAG TPA: diaminopimelate decarboxylase [Casimicrobiaceae bacterium]|nr:diaminopimelate decarboxylase [Casimicrobiaceae bacterium]